MVQMLSLALMAQAAAGATAPAANPPSPLASVYACAQRAEPDARLACYDAAVAELRAAEGRQDVVAFDRQRVEQVRREAFGFRLPSLPRLGLPGPRPAPDAPETANAAEIEEQTFTVARVGMSGDRFRLWLDNGQVWQFVDAGDMAAGPRPPFRIRIRGAAFGSFMMTVEGRNRGYRVRRIE